MRVFITLSVFSLCLINLSKCNSTDFLQQILNKNYQNLTLSEKCKNDLKIVQNGIASEDIWALKMLDASGRVRSGFVWGNDFWLGSKSGCARISNPYKLAISLRYHRQNVENLTDIVAPIPVIYRVTYARHFSKYQMDLKIMDKSIIHIGLCLPKACDNDDTKTLMSHIFQSNDYFGHELLSNNVTVIETKELKLRESFYREPYFFIFITLFIISILLITMSEIYEFIKNRISSISSIRSMESNNNEGQTKEKKRLKEGVIVKILKCFSIKENVNILFSNNLGTESIAPIHGMRAICMIWIILGHTFLYAGSAVSNEGRVLTYATDWYMQPIYGVVVAVDAFFIISGILISFIIFEYQKKNPKRGGGIWYFLQSTGNRLFRIAPSYFTSMTLAIVCGFYLKDRSQYFLLENVEENCQKYWWRNLLFINNLFPFSEICLSWSWYLSADFQCFLITSALLTVWSRQRAISMTLFGIIFTIATVFNGYMGYVLNYQFLLDVEYQTIDYLYLPTWIRLTPYLCGVFGGWYLSNYEKKLHLNQKMIYFLWTVSMAVILLLVFGRINKNMPILLSMFYTAFGRIAWALAISWLIIACATGHGGIMTKILEAKCLLPLSRMSYAAYLINPIWIMFSVMSAEEPLFLDYASLLTLGFGIICGVYLFAFIFMLLFESPFIRLIRTFIEGK